MKTYINNANSYIYILNLTAHHVSKYTHRRRALSVGLRCTGLGDVDVAAIHAASHACEHGSELHRVECRGAGFAAGEGNAWSAELFGHVKHDRRGHDCAQHLGFGTHLTLAVVLAIHARQRLLKASHVFGHVRSPAIQIQDRTESIVGHLDAREDQRHTVSQHIDSLHFLLFHQFAPQLKLQGLQRIVLVEIAGELHALLLQSLQLEQTRLLLQTFVDVLHNFRDHGRRGLRWF